MFNNDAPSLIVEKLNDDIELIEQFAKCECVDKLDYILPRLNDLNSLDSSGHDILYYSIKHHNVDLFDYLSSMSRVNIWKKYEHGRNIFHISAIHDFVEILFKYNDILDYDLNQVDDGNNTPLDLSDGECSFKRTLSRLLDGDSLF